MQVKNLPSLVLIHPNFASGGAEKQILQLLDPLSQTSELHVVLFDDLERKIPNIKVGHRDVSFHNLEKQPGILHLPRLIWKLYRLVNQIRPSILISFLDHVNILSLLVGRITGTKNIVWGLRTSSFEAGEFGIKGDLVRKAGILLSRKVDLLVSNNRTGLVQYKNLGAQPKRSMIIHNGIDTELFKPSQSQRIELRQELGIGEEQIVIGIVARLVPWKGYEIFLQAAAMVTEKQNNVVFVCVGQGELKFEKYCKNLVSTLGLQSSVKWLGDRHDVAKILNGIDIFVLSSTSGEGFSNALCEAMAVARPVIVTDVGDSKDIVQSQGIVVAPNNHTALAEAIIRALADPLWRTQVGGQARQRIIESYSVSNCSKRFTKLINDLV